MTTSPPTAAALLADLRRTGVVLSVNGDRLAFDAPAEAMTSQVRALLVEHKQILIRELTGRLDRQLDQLVPAPASLPVLRGSLIHRDLLRPEAKDELSFVDLVDWALNRPPPVPAAPTPPPWAPREQCLAGAEAAGWPSLEIRPGERIIGAPPAWHQFTEHAFAPDVTAALAKLRESETDL